MKSTSEELVEQLVARLIERQSKDPQNDLDRILSELPEVDDREAIREASLHRYSRTVSGSGTIPVSSRRDDELPELEGYHVIDCIGRGGMGSVYEAYQQSTGRRVAVKFMLAPLESSETSRRRFEREVELVARLEHPNIVSIIDSGIHAGQYFFVMEFVEGQTLDAAMPRGECSTRAALAILCEIATTVDYAHQRGVLHRDLKPSNIVIGKDGKPHLLDFGLAKALDDFDPQRMDASLSRPGDLVGTLGYMSPEQSRGLTSAVSVRSDVYSLGAITYELLTGELPVRVDGELVDILSGIRDLEPARPSSIRTNCDADVDAILLKALAKQPEQRYATAGEFAADIERYLQGLPIYARPISGVARSWRWVRRHRAISSITGAAIAIVLTVVAVSFLRISDARYTAESVNKALQTMFLMVDPDAAGGDVMSIPRFLDEVSHWLDSGAAGPPAVEAEMRGTLGKMYLKLGQSMARQAELQFKKVLEILKRTGGSDASIAAAQIGLAAARWNMGQYPEAEAIYRSAHELRKGLFPTESVEIAEVRHHLATCLDSEGRHEEAAELFELALATRIRLLGEENEETAATHIFFAICLDRLGRTKEAVVHTKSAVDAVEGIYGTHHWRVVRGIRLLAIQLQKIGDLKGAEAQLARAAEGFAKLYGEDSADAVNTRKQLDHVRELINSTDTTLDSTGGNTPSADSVEEPKQEK